MTLPLDVSTPSDDYRRMSRRWPLPRALMGGTAAMQDAGTLYLPKEPAETAEDYTSRLSRTTLFNGFRKTIKDMAGKVFARPIEIGDDMPPDLVTYAENVDLTGRHLDVFAHDVFKDALQTGICHILVEMPVKVEGEERTLADEINAGVRPYFIHLPAEDVIGWRSALINGIQTLTQLRVKQVVKRPLGDFAEVDVNQVRVLEPGGFRIYEQSMLRNNAGWNLVADGTTGLSKITLATVYLNRTDFMMGAPPLEDLADINRAHWQSQSDQRHILHVARVPFMFGAGIPDTTELIIGPNRLVRVSDPAASLGYVEHSGAAIGAGRNDLKDLELQMQVMGLELLIPQPGNLTATGKAIDEAAMNSPLAMMANALKDGLEQAFGFMAEYINLGADRAGSLTVNTDFGVSLRNAADLVELREARKMGEISQETYLSELARRGVLSEGFDPEDEMERIKIEGPPLGMIPPTPMPGSQEESIGAAGE